MTVISFIMGDLLLLVKRLDIKTEGRLSFNIKTVLTNTGTFHKDRRSYNCFPFIIGIILLLRPYRYQDSL